MVSRVKPSGIWHKPTTFYLGGGIGPTGAVILAVTGLVSVFALLTSNPIRNMAGCLIVGGVLVAGFVVRDRNDRHLYEQAVFRVQWWWHVRTGRNLYLGHWLSTRPVTATNLPGLLTQASVGAQPSARGEYAVVQHAAANVTTVVVECFPRGTQFTSDQVPGLVSKWADWIGAFSNDPSVVGFTVVTVTAATPKPAIDLASKGFVDRPGVIGEAFNQITGEMAGAPATRIFVSVSLTNQQGMSVNKWTAAALSPVVELVCGTLENAGAGHVKPVSRDELMRAWKTAFDPSTAATLAAHPTVVVSPDQVGPATAEEFPWGWNHAGFCTVGVSMCGTPNGHLTEHVYERAAEGLPGVDRVTTLTSYRPLRGTERGRFARGARSGVAWKQGLSGDGQVKAVDHATITDIDQTATDVMRGGELVKVGFSATATFREAGREQAEMVTAHLKGMCGPLGATIQAMDRANQTAHNSCLPGMFPAAEAYKTWENIQ